MLQRKGYSWVTGELVNIYAIVAMQNLVTDVPGSVVWSNDSENVQDPTKCANGSTLQRVNPDFV